MQMQQDDMCCWTGVILRDYSMLGNKPGTISAMSLVFWLQRRCECSKNPVQCARPLALPHPQVTFVQEQGSGDEGTCGVLPPWQHGCSCHNRHLWIPRHACCKNLVDLGCWKVTWSDFMGPRSSLGRQGWPHIKCLVKHLSLPLQMLAHTAGAVCGKAILSWSRIYTCKILINPKDLSGKEPNIRLTSEHPELF